ncbi:hypothetical protein [Streptomyces sp. NPDC004324]
MAAQAYPSVVDRMMQAPGPTNQHLTVALKADHIMAEIKSFAHLVDDAGQASRKLTEELLARAEQSTGLPCATSGILHGLAPRPRPMRLTFEDFGTNLALVVPQWVFDELLRPPTLIESQVQPSLLEMHQIREALARVHSMLRGIKAAALRALNLQAWARYEFLGSVPQHDASPCGVLGLASPIVPGAPARRPTSHKQVMAIAA